MLLGDTSMLSLRVLFLTTVGASVLLSGTSFAQMEEITVTARKKSENLQDVPISITAFDERMIEQKGIQTILDVAKATPSLVFDKGFVSQDTRPQIRGLPATRGRPPVAILLNGIDVSSEAFSTGGGGNLMNLRLLDLERVEVVKGPQSALYGRTAFGGAINYISKKAPDSFEGNLNAGIAEGGLYEIKGAVGGPVVEDRLSLRVQGSYAEFDGFYANSVSGEDLGGYEDKGVSVAAKWTPTDRFTANTTYLYSENTSEPRAQYHIGFINGTSTAVPLPSNTTGVRLGTALAPAISFIPTGAIREGNAIQISLDPRTGKDYLGASLDLHLINLQAEYDLGGATFSSWFGYVDADAVSLQDIDFYGLPWRAVTLPAPGGIAEPLQRAFESNLITNTKQTNLEVRLASDGDSAVGWAVGGLYWKEKLNQSAGSSLTNLSTPGASASLNTQLTRNPTIRGVQARNTEHYSVYGLVEYEIVERLTASAEARYSWEDLAVRFAPSIGVTGTGLTPVVSIFTGPTNIAAKSSSEFFAPKFTLQYELNEDANVYATVSKGVKPGGYSTTGFTTNPDLVKVRAETLWNYELGAKTSWLDGLFVANSAAFYMDYKNKVLQTLIPDPNNPLGVTTAAVNASDARIYGLEADLGWNISDLLRFNAGYTYLDAKYTDFTNNTTSGVEIVTAGNCRLVQVVNTQVCNVSYTGNRMERIPKHSGNLGLTYRAPISSDIDLVANTTGTFRSKRFDDEGNKNFYESYFTADASLTVEADMWSATLYVSNVFDDDTVQSGQGVTDIFAIPTPGRFITAYAPDPRQFGFRTSYRF